MKLLRVLGALLLLISSDSFSFEHKEFSSKNSNIEFTYSSNLEEGSYVVYDSHLSAQTSLTQSSPFFIWKNFDFYSSHSERTDKEYLCYSSIIVPSLAIANIIFPFHSFL